MMLGWWEPATSVRAGPGPGIQTPKGQSEQIGVNPTAVLDEASGPQGEKNNPLNNLSQDCNLASSALS